MGQVLIARSVVAALGLILSGCGAVTYSGHDLRVETSGNTVYLFARDTGVTRNLCSGLGGDVARRVAQNAATDSKSMQLAQIAGCYTVRHIIVCADGDEACMTHETKHRDLGAFHR